MFSYIIFVSFLLAFSVAQEKHQEKDTSADDAGANPQARFLPGLQNIFNSCSRCHPGDQREADRCCRSGERQCCFIQPSFSQAGFGHQGFHTGFNGRPGFSGFPGHHGVHGQGFHGNTGFHGQGFHGNTGFHGQGFHGNTGFHGQGFHGNTGFHGQGFPQAGFQHGQFGHNGFNNFHHGSNVKPGFCQKKGLFGGLFGRSNSGASDSTSLRSGLDTSKVTDPKIHGNTETQEGRSNRRVRQVKFPGNEVNTLPVDSRSSSGSSPGAEVNQANPSARFFFKKPFGPGPLIPNPFCRDECFNDFNCPGNLKCCLRDCNKCENPSFF